jgi:CBS domain-containing protein
MLLPLLVANFLAHGFTVLALKRSILTEKISRRGYHLSREYAVDPLEILFVREVMRTKVVALPAEATIEEARELMRPHRAPGQHGQHIFPIIDQTRRVLGVVSRNHLLGMPEEALAGSGGKALREFTAGEVSVAYPDESLRVVVYRMAESGFTRFPVVDDNNQLVGMLALDDLLRARSRNLEEERARERVFKLRLPIGRRVTETT